MLRYLVFTLLIAFSPVTATGPTDSKQVCASKLVGIWEGQGGCDGNLEIRADRTFQLKGYGPGGDTLSGLWHVEWQGQTPTLFLADKQPGSPYGVLKFPIRKLDSANLKFNHEKNGPSGEYKRAKVKKAD